MEIKELIEKHNIKIFIEQCTEQTMNPNDIITKKEFREKYNEFYNKFIEEYHKTSKTGFTTQEASAICNNAKKANDWIIKKELAKVAVTERYAGKKGSQKWSWEGIKLYERVLIPIIEI